MGLNFVILTDKITRETPYAHTQQRFGCAYAHATGAIDRADQSISQRVRAFVGVDTSELARMARREGQEI